MIIKKMRLISIIVSMLFIFSNIPALSDTLPGSTQAPDISNVTIINNPLGTPATLTVTLPLLADDIVNVYNDSSIGPHSLIGTAIASGGTPTTVVSMDQLSLGSGQVWVTITSPPNTESTPLVVPYEAEPVALSDDDVKIYNNYVGIPDEITVTSNQTPLGNGDLINVYADAANNPGIKIGTGPVTTINGTTSATIYINQIGTTAGQLWISIKSSTAPESAKIPVQYQGEPSAPVPDSKDVTITNNYVGVPDIIKLINSSQTPLLVGDIVKIYKDNSNSPGALIGTARATLINNTTTAAISISQVGTLAGQIWISISKGANNESTKVSVPYSSEPISTPPLPANVTIVNNADKSDTLDIIGLQVGDVVKAYKNNLTTSAAFAISPAATLTNNTTTASISVPQLGSSPGKVFLSVTSNKMNESQRVPVDYIGEPATQTPVGAVAVNNVDSNYKDTITLTGINPKDILKVYKDASCTALLGASTVITGATSATISLISTILGASSGNVYVTLKSPNLRESDPQTVPYSAEAQVSTPTAIAVYNYAGCPDVVTVSGLNSGDTVKVWNSSTKGTLLKSGVVKTGKSRISLNITQLSKNSGSIWVSVKSVNMLESDRAKVDYNAELK